MFFKKITYILIALVILLFLSTGIYAQYNAEEGSDKSFCLTWYPLSMIIGTYSFEAEIILSPVMTLNGEFKYMDWEFGDWTLSSLMLGPGIRYYPQARAPEDYYVGLYFNYQTAEVSFEYRDINYQKEIVTSNAGGGSVIFWFGKKWVMGILCAEFGTGFGYVYVSGGEVEYTDIYGNQQTEEYSGRGASGFGWAGISMGMGLSF